MIDQGRRQQIRNLLLVLQERKDMIDIERTIYVGCPCGCGQIGVAVSLKKILEKESFFCEACGAEISGPDYPGFLSETVSAPGSKADAQLLSQVRDLYEFFYGDPAKFAGKVLGRLLPDYPQYSSLFPLSVLPGKVIVSRLKKDKVFAGEFLEKHAENCVWQKFTCGDFINLFSIFPELTDKCTKWNQFTPKQWLELLAVVPKTADKCTKWNEFTTEQWMDLLAAVPKTADKCTKWNQFTPEQWGLLKSRTYTLYSQYFTRQNLGIENYLNCVASNPRLLEKDVEYIKSEVSDAAETIIDAAKDFWRKLW